LPFFSFLQIWRNGQFRPALESGDLALPRRCFREWLQPSRDQGLLAFRQVTPVQVFDYDRSERRDALPGIFFAEPAAQCRGTVSSVRLARLGLSIYGNAV
jgi:hypothetical protein